MSPEQLRLLNEINDRLKTLESVRNVAFIKEVRRQVLANAQLSDLSDVSDTDSASTGEVLKKTSTTWQPGTDNTA